MAIDNTGISSLDTGASDITYTGNEGPKSPQQEQQMQMQQQQQMQQMKMASLMQEYKDYAMQQEEAGRPVMPFEEWVRSIQSPMAYGGTARPTYTQSRRQRINAAGGGIMGSNAGSMLVAPTADGSRPGYGWLSKIKDKFVDDIIPNEIKENPMLSAAVLGAGVNQFGLIPGMGGGVGDFGKNWIGDLLGGKDAVIGGIRPEGQKPLIDFSGIFSGNQSNVDKAKNILTGGGINPADPSTWEKANQLLNDPTGALKSAALQQFQKLTQQQNPGASLLDKFKNYMGPNEQGVNWKTPLAIGSTMGAIQAGMPKSVLPQDTSGIDMASAIRGDELRFRPKDEVLAAQGGRIGYAEGTDKGPLYVDPNISYEDFPLTEFERDLRYTSKEQRQEKYNEFLRRLEGMTDEEKKELLHYGPQPYGSGSGENVRALEYTDDPVSEEFYETGEHFNKGGIAQLAQGGRIGYERGRVVRPGGYAGAIDRNIANLQTAWELETDPDKKAEIKILLDEQMKAKGGFTDKTLSGDPVPKETVPEEEGSFWDFLPGIGKAQGGRIGYNRGRVVNPGGYAGETDYENWLIDNYDLLVTDLSFEDHAKYSKAFRAGQAQGGRIGAQEGGLMNLGGMEKDYRQEGGFVPLGGEEKADDVPARLSKNEFVFTADAVRSAGGGDIDAGAEIMENLMNNLEQGGQVSEESQGLEGARDMFATAQRLEGVM